MSKIHITTDAEWQAHFEEMGRQDRSKGVTKNPYMTHTRAHAAWQKGYKSK
jgi:hypothetical protein